MNEKKAKIRFNFADALIVLVLFFLISWMITDVAFDDASYTASESEELTVRLSDASSALYAMSKTRLEEDTNVYDLETGVLIGSLAAVYEGDSFLRIRLADEFKRKYLPGDMVNLKMGHFLLYDSVVTAVYWEEAS